MTNTKLSNPKDAVGTRKVPFSTLPTRVLYRVGLAMMEGALKYGRHNYRAVGVRASVYFDAVVARHIVPWWEGEDIDPDSGLNHIDKAIAGLMVLRDSMLQGNWEDDRPPASVNDLYELNHHAGILIDKYGHLDPKHCTQTNARPPITSSTVTFDARAHIDHAAYQWARSPDATQVVAEAARDFKPVVLG